MKLYVLYTSYPYPYKGGYVHGVFSSRELAERYFNENDIYLGFNNSHIEEIELDKFSYLYIEI